MNLCIIGFFIIFIIIAVIYKMTNYITIVKKGTNNKNKAIAQMRSHDESKILGYLYLDETDKGTHIYGDLDGFESLTNDGLKGFHIHEKGNSKGCCDSLGGHYNPLNKEHSGRTIIVNGVETTNHNRHIGDLGNIQVINGKVHIDIYDPLIKLNGEYNVIGRSIIIHHDQDDLGLGNYPDSKTTGHSGKRICYGIIAHN